MPAPQNRVVLLAVCAGAVALRHLVSLWPYSGYQSPPMHGDYEAQRHWMEITINLPVSQWYWHDRQYWGLDYPPLTAYVSWACGLVSHALMPGSMALGTSRGYEAPAHKALMRALVAALDVATWFPAALLGARALRTQARALAAGCSGQQQQQQQQRRTQFKGVDGAAAAVAAMALLQPALVLVDHGHYQYNCVCVGLAVGAAVAVTAGAEYLGAALFALSLNFKHMALYYAPAVFFFLLRGCLDRPSPAAAVAHVAKLGAVVVATFGAQWWPFCVYGGEGGGGGCAGGLLQVLRSLFPFDRGIFEDKVANIWCCADALLKLRRRVPKRWFPPAAALLTAIMLVPVGAELLRRGRERSLRRLLLAMTVSAFAFFLAAFQVHEKGVLLPLAPLSLLWAEAPLLVTWLQVMGAFSLFPLLKREGLAVPYAVCTAAYAVASYVLAQHLPSSAATPANAAAAAAAASAATDSTQPRTAAPAVITDSRAQAAGATTSYLTPFPYDGAARALACGSCAAAALLHAAEAAAPAPAPSLPHLYPVLNALVACAAFCAGYALCVLWLWSEAPTCAAPAAAAAAVAKKRD